MEKGEFIKKTKKYWYLLVLLAIVIAAFWFRTFPARFGELQALDPFYMYRISEHILTHNFQLPEVDTLRNYPYGDTRFDYRLTLYLPPTLYVILNPLLQMSYFEFALLYPAIMGALAVLVIFFIGRELFDWKAGLFAAFFLATVPAFITRTSAGFLEKEPTAAPFMLLSIFFFIKAFKESDWKQGTVWGILSGLMLAAMGTAWGGVQYIYAFYAAFAFIMLLLNKYQTNLLVSYAPTILLGLLIIQFIPPFPISLISTIPLFSFGVLAILLLRISLERFNFVKEENLKYLTPAIIVIGAIGVLMGSMFSDFIYGYVQSFIQSFINLIMLKQPLTTTVAESTGGNWNTIAAITGAGFSAGILPELSFASVFASLWLFFTLGILLMLYKICRYREFLFLIPLVWIVLAFFGVFYMIRLTFLVGAPAAVMGGFFLSWLINKTLKIKTLKDDEKTVSGFTISGLLFLFLTAISLFFNILIAAACITVSAISFLLGYAKKSEISKHEKIDLIAVPIIIFLVFTMLINLGNAYAYSNSIGPSINQYWYEAMDYLKNETPENSSVLSWWDFGYWFQTRGERPTIVDGGGVGATSRYDVALWFTSPAANWSEWDWWLKDKLNVSYILMDYTLPGKYVAITKIESDGKDIVGIQQFQHSGAYPKDNKTIYEFSAGPYAIWIPLEGGTIAGTPMFLVSQNRQYLSKAYINDVCTTNGILHMGDETPSIGGCVAITDFGVFYVPEKAKNTIFTNLMFMNGHGLPLEKVFDNSLIKIYKVEY